LGDTFSWWSIGELDINCVIFKISWEIGTYDRKIIGTKNVQEIIWLDGRDSAVDLNPYESILNWNSS